MTTDHDAPHEDRYDVLFEPVQIGPVTAPNRFYAVPHATGHGRAEPNGSIALRGMKAEGGWGVVAVQMTEIAPDSDMASHPMDSLWDNRDFPMHQKQVEAIQRHGALAAIELAHGGMRARNMKSGLPVVGPSSLPVLRPEVPSQARAMDRRDIKDFRLSHQRAAQRAKRAGYDILYVYAAHDLSILSHYLSLRTNQRTDEYGGSFENRIRLLREVLTDTLEIASGECAVALRFSVSEPGQTPGLTHDGEGRDVVEALAELPDLWDVNISGWSQDSATARFTDEGFQLPFTDFVKSVTHKPVVGVGRFTTPDKMVSVIKKGQLDLIGGARPSIADPFLPNKIRAGRLLEIRECIGCNICVSMDSYGLPLNCTQNPTIAEEWKRRWHPEFIPARHTAHRQSSTLAAVTDSSNRSSSIATSPAAIITGADNLAPHLIIGAGPAGLECAWTLARAGEKIILAEALEVAGGRVTRECQLPGLASWARVRDYRVQQLNQCANVEIYYASRLSARDIIEVAPETLTLATGSRWRTDGVGSSCTQVLRLDGVRVFSPDDLMQAGFEDELAGKRRIVVYDDDHYYMASVLAEKLAGMGHDVAYVTPLAMVATWTDMTLEQQRIISRLSDLGVNLFVNTSMSDGPTFLNTLTGKSVQFDMDALVFVGAREPVISVQHEWQELRGTDPTDALDTRPAHTHIGDCMVPGLIQAAVFSGHKRARYLLGDRFSGRSYQRETTLLG